MLARDLRKSPSEEKWMVNDREYNKFETWRLINTNKSKIALFLSTCYIELGLKNMPSQPTSIFLLNYPFQYDVQYVLTTIERKKYQLVDAEDLKKFYQERMEDWMAILDVERQFLDDTNGYRLMGT